MQVQGNFTIQDPKELSSDLSLNGQPYHMVVKATKDNKHWKLDITLSSPSMIEAKTHTVTLESFSNNKAVIGMGLNPLYHRKNECLVDFSEAIDAETASAIKKVGESILVTATQIGATLKLVLESNQSGVLKDVK